MSAPESLYIDARVAERMPAEPPESDAPTVQYLRMDIAQAMVAQASGDTEFFIQLLAAEGALLGLTNYGRIFTKVYSSNDWEPIPGPRLEDPA